MLHWVRDEVLQIMLCAKRIDLRKPWIALRSAVQWQVLAIDTKAVEERLASRIYDLLDVTVDANDCLYLSTSVESAREGWRPWRDQLKISSGLSFWSGIITEPCRAEIH